MGCPNEAEFGLNVSNEPSVGYKYSQSKAFVWSTNDSGDEMCLQLTKISSPSKGNELDVAREIKKMFIFPE